MPYFLLGNDYVASQPELAVIWFNKGLPFAKNQAPNLNNYAVLLSSQGCYQQAEQMMKAALKIAPTDPTLLGSQLQIAAPAFHAETKAASLAQAAQSPAVIARH